MEILKFDELERWEFFPKIFGRVLINGERMTFFLVEVPPRSSIPMHNHEHEQMGICLQGRAEFLTQEKQRIVKKRMVYRFAPNEKHAVKALGEQTSIFLDAFSPQRTDYLQRQQRFEKL